ncbi:ABC transporter ATP-binding protein [Gracilibacillus phocaeensis]|uniref:ABC transporter ATP-binding protein n=1 Tax=Gracilibacillus phocaeensis TaxID=2042304 RepID=UPI00103266C9|nr:ABC transporter ATP-binding protein [Gracilibacillus phocaeensis]
MDNVIELRGVSKAFNGFSIEDVDLQIKQGYITGFIGENGAGKSTMIKLIMNLLEPDEGEVRVFGLDYTRHAKEIKGRIGFVYDQNIYYPSLSLKDISKIVAPAYQHWDKQQFAKYVDQFELPFHQPIKKLSKGMQMKASIAMALSHDAELIVMDEPTTGLDPTFRRQLHDIFQEVMMDERKSIFFSTHITSDLERLADYIALVDKGEILFHQSINDLRDQYTLVKGSMDLLDRDTEKNFVNIDRSSSGFQALTNDIAGVKDVFGDQVVIERASLEDIMFYVKNGHR